MSFYAKVIKSIKKYVNAIKICSFAIFPKNFHFSINDVKIRDEKLQNDINSKAAKISELSFGKIDTYEYLTGEEILHSGQKRLIEQATFTYSPLGKAFEKQIKTMEDQGRKQINAITNQNKRLAALTNKNDDKDNYKEIFEELVK